MPEKTRWYWKCGLCNIEYYVEDYEFCYRCGQRRRYPADETDDSIRQMEMHSRTLNLERRVNALERTIKSLRDVLVDEYGEDEE